MPYVIELKFYWCFYLPSETPSVNLTSGIRTDG